MLNLFDLKFSEEVRRNSIEKKIYDSYLKWLKKLKTENLFFI